MRKCLHTAMELRYAEEFACKLNDAAKDDGISLTREMIRVFSEGGEPKA